LTKFKSLAEISSFLFVLAEFIQYLVKAKLTNMSNQYKMKEIEKAVEI
jgi:hypothetical protein